MGEQRFFNKSDLAIEVYDDHVVARSGPSVLLTVTLAPAAVSGFLRTNVSFFNNSTAGLSSRRAGDTTVNAAFLAEIVPTTDGSYSGGVENFPRFLEDWANRTLTYNGSMIVMFSSAIATGTWKSTGRAYGIYNPPRRNWAFDVSFLNPGRLPPGTPEIRGQWSMAAPSPTTTRLLHLPEIGTITNWVLQTSGRSVAFMPPHRWETPSRHPRPRPDLDIATIRAHLPRHRPHPLPIPRHP